MEERGRCSFVVVGQKTYYISIPPNIVRTTRPFPPRKRANSLPAPRSKLFPATLQQAPLLKLSKARQKYQYDPLGPKEIRRLRLHMTSNHNEPLCGLLETVPLSAYNSYSAISYVWGENSQTFQLLVGENYYIPLTESLDRLLRDLRQSTSKRVKQANRLSAMIWVDQICINQEDSHEKARQVAMMSEIYKTAERVVAYIGSEEPGDIAALDFMLNFIKMYKKQDLRGRQLSRPEWTDLLPLLGDIPEDDDPMWSKIKYLLCGEWVIRSWIFQELVLNTNTYVLRGTHFYHTDILTTFGTLLAYEVEFPFHPLLRIYSASCYQLPPHSSPPLWMFAQQLHNIGRARYLSLEGKEKVTTLYLLQRNMNLRASIPRDKIYSLLGLAIDAKHLEIDPDYSKSDVEIFTDLARHLFLAEQDLQILEYVHDAPSSSTDPWPSWVPDWMYAGQNNRRYGGITDVFKAADSVRSTIDFSEDGKCLFLKGIVVDTITEVFGVPCSGYFLNKPSIFLRCQEYHQTYLRTMQAVCDDPTSPSIEEHQRFILVTAMGTDMYIKPVNLDRTWKDFCIWLSFITSTVKTPMPRDPTDKQVFAWYANFRLTVLTAKRYFTPLWNSFGRAICITGDGRLCMGTHRARAGDKITVLLGGRMCYILRPVLETMDQFEFIGDTYCENLMQGEALSDPKLTEKIRDITIV